MLDNACVGDTLTRGIRAGPGVLAQGGGRLPRAGHAAHDPYRYLTTLALRVPGVSP